MRRAEIRRLARAALASLDRRLAAIELRRRHGWPLPRELGLPDDVVAMLTELSRLTIAPGRRLARLGPAPFDVAIERDDLVTFAAMLRWIARQKPTILDEPDAVTKRGRRFATLRRLLESIVDCHFRQGPIPIDWARAEAAWPRAEKDSAPVAEDEPAPPPVPVEAARAAGGEPPSALPRKDRPKPSRAAATEALLAHGGWERLGPRGLSELTTALNEGRGGKGQPEKLSRNTVRRAREDLLGKQQK